MQAGPSSAAGIERPGGGANAGLFAFLTASKMVALRAIDVKPRWETQMKPQLKLIVPESPTPVFRAVGARKLPRRPPNSELRTCEHLTPAEVDRLIAAAKGNRHGF